MCKYEKRIDNSEEHKNINDNYQGNDIRKRM